MKITTTKILIIGIILWLIFWICIANCIANLTGVYKNLSSMATNMQDIKDDFKNLDIKCK